MPQPVLVGGAPGRVHGLALAVHAPPVVSAAGAVHRRPLLGLAHVRRGCLAAPQVGARVVELEAPAELESVSELHPALVVQAVGVLDAGADEDGLLGVRRIVEHA